MRKWDRERVGLNEKGCEREKVWRDRPPVSQQSTGAALEEKHKFYKQDWPAFKHLFFNENKR